MACKFLEIGSGQSLPPTRFELLEVQKDTFMLKTKNSHVGLLVTLEKWLESNYPMGESLFIGGYQKLIQWSVIQGKVTKYYGDIMAGGIRSMVQCSAKKFLFLSDTSGC
jgi:WD40 repeat protein